MIAYNGDAQLKADLLAEVHKHYLADQIVKGTYGDESSDQFKGCAVGCSIHSYNLLRGERHQVCDHSVFENFGIPQLLARLNDRIFEGLPDTHNKQWPERFLSAIRPGADLSKIWPKFAHWLMVDPDHGVMRFAGEFANVRNAIQGVADLYADGEWPSAAAAADAADAAAAAAADAADAAAAAAAAADAAADAADAAAAAAAAADAADAAAADAAAARYNEYIAQADKLVELLQAA